MPSINRHFKIENWFMVAVLLGPIILGVASAFVLPWVLSSREDSASKSARPVESDQAAITAAKQAWYSIYEKTGNSSYSALSTSMFEPYSASLDSGTWTVRGSIPNNYHGEFLVTQVLQSNGGVSVRVEGSR